MQYIDFYKKNDLHQNSGIKQRNLNNNRIKAPNIRLYKF